MRQAESMRSRVKCGNLARQQRCLRMVTESAHRRAAKASEMRYVRKEQKIAPKDKLAGFKQRTTVLPATAPVAVADPASAFAAEDASSAISEPSETEAKALIGAPRVGGTIECGCGGRASAVALNAAASCAVHLQRVRRRMRRSRMAGTTRTKPSWKCAHELPPCNSSSLCARCLLRSDPICMGGVR